MSAAALMLFAWAIEALIGWPDGLYRRIKHPVVWFGALVARMDKALNQMARSHSVRYVLGVFSTLVLVGLSVAIALGVSWLLPNTWWGFAIEAALASSLIASRSLYAHVRAVAIPLTMGDPERARLAVSQIVGRDPEHLNEAGMTRASLESLAENASDGIIAPLFWGALFGVPGLAAYKAINTLDSMIGHRNSQYSAFGGFAARLDDLVNLIPARLTGGLIVVAGMKPSAVGIMFRDARHHRSPNAGWPEAAMAGALGVRLSGPRHYGRESTEEPWLNADAPDPAPRDLSRGLALYVRALGLAAGGLAVIAWGLS
ncbi:MAG: adenosylcobinamide-phosphate synthase CbiB [Pseudomonadota bacterium]